MSEEKWIFNKDSDISDTEKKATKKAVNKNIKENPNLLKNIESQNGDVVLVFNKEKLKEFEQEIINLNKKMGDLILEIESSKTNEEDLEKIEREIQGLIIQIEKNENKIKEIKSNLQKAAQKTSEFSRN